MSRGNKHEIAVTETILGLIVVALVAFIGWFVWTRAVDANDTYNASNASSNQTVAKAEPQPTPSKACELTNDEVGQTTAIAQKAFAFCLPNGWELSKSGSDLAYFAYETSLVYDETTKPSIKDVGGSDSAYEFFMAYRKAGEADQIDLDEYDAATAPKLTDGLGLTVSAYYHLTTKDDPVGAGIDYLPRGTKQYLYVIEKATDPQDVLEIHYNVAPGKAGMRTSIERLVASVHLPQ